MEKDQRERHPFAQYFSCRTPAANFSPFLTQQLALEREPAQRLCDSP